MAIEIAVAIKLLMMSKSMWRMGILILIMIETVGIVANVDLDLKIDWRLVLIPAYSAFAICAYKAAN